MSRRRLLEGGTRLLLGRSGEHTRGRLLGGSNAGQCLKSYIINSVNTHVVKQALHRRLDDLCCNVVLV